MSVYNCYDCNKVLCKDCSRKHNNEEKYRIHSMQLISDSFILNFRFRLRHIGPFHQLVCDVKCLPNGELLLATTDEVTIYSVSGIQRHTIQLKYLSVVSVVDRNTVAVLLSYRGVAIVDIQQMHVQYIDESAMPLNAVSFMYIENEFYIGDEYDIVVFDMSGSVKRHITLSFTPCAMRYDSDSQHIYCINSKQSQLLCIDRDGNDIFTFTDPNMTNLRDLTIDNEGNILVLCKKEDDSRYVTKVDSNGEKSEVVISNTNMSSHPRICYDHLTNSVVIGVSDTVYIYKKNT